MPVTLELYYNGVDELKTLLAAVVLPLHALVGLSRVLITYKGRPSAADNPRDAALLRGLLPAPRWVGRPPRVPAPTGSRPDRKHKVAGTPQWYALSADRATRSEDNPILGHATVIEVFMLWLSLIEFLRSICSMLYSSAAVADMFI